MSKRTGRRGSRVYLGNLAYNPSPEALTTARDDFADLVIASTVGTGEDVLRLILAMTPPQRLNLIYAALGYAVATTEMLAQLTDSSADRVVEEYRRAQVPQ